jgi:hypothetical protein
MWKCVSSGTFSRSRLRRTKRSTACGELGRLDRQLDGTLDAPAVAEFDEVTAAGNLHHDTLSATVDGDLDIGDHAARERVDGRGKVSRNDAPDGLGVSGGDGWKAGLDPVDSSLRGPRRCAPCRRR